MSGEVQAQPVVATTQARPTLTPAPFEVQRTCACGGSGSSSVAGHCAECDRRRLTVQRYPLDHVPPTSLLQSFPASPRPAVQPGHRVNMSNWDPGRHQGIDYSFGSVRLHSPALHAFQTGVQPKFPISQPGDKHEQEADGVAEHVTASLQTVALGSKIPPLARSEPPGLGLDGSGLPVQGMPADQQAAIPEAETDAVHAGFIAEDAADELAPGQMRKTEFFDELQRAVHAAADAELAAVGRTAKGCPYIERWIGYYRARSSSHVEKALHRYAPEAAAAGSALDYIPVVAQRVRRAASVWAATGEITGVPDELASLLPRGGLLGAAASVVSGIGAAVSGVTGSLGRIFTKAKDGGARQPDDPDQIQAGLGAGRSLDSGVRSRMESAFGYDFSRVRVHTDSNAASESSRLNARAFTIGSDIAFGAREYQPGTPIGDALLAHELAHVVQQRSGPSAASSQNVESGYQPLEEDADRSAIGVIGLLWGGNKGFSNRMRSRATPKLTSGPRLQRCGPSPTPAVPRTEPSETPPQEPVQPEGPTVKFEGSLSPGNSLQFPSGDQSLGLKDLRDRWTWQVEVGGTVADDASSWALKQSLVGRRKLVLHNPAGTVHRQTADINTPDDSPGSDFRQNSPGHRYFWIDAPGHKKNIDEWTVDSLTQVQNITSWVEKASEKREVKWHLKTVVNDGAKLDTTNTEAGNDHISTDL